MCNTQTVCEKPKAAAVVGSGTKKSKATNTADDCPPALVSHGTDDNGVSGHDSKSVSVLDTVSSFGVCSIIVPWVN